MKDSASPHFDELIHAPLRLRICVLIAPVDSMAFAALREELGVAESVVSKHLKVLSEAGYITLEKSIRHQRRSTWVRMTVGGRAALSGHLAALQLMAEMAERHPLEPQSVGTGAQ